MKLEHLRKQIAKIERRHVSFHPVADGNGSGWKTGCEAIDAALPEAQMARGALHDFSVFRPRDTPAMDRFVLALLMRLPATRTMAANPRPDMAEIIWCQATSTIREHGLPYGPGLKALGLAPERLVIVSLPKERDLAFVMEEALRSGAVAAVIGEGAPLGFTASRRLSLTCQEMAIPCLFLNSTGAREASAATTRWRIAPAIGPPDLADPLSPGIAAWSVVLARARGGRAHPDSLPWTVFWNDETHSFNLVAPSGDGTLAKSPHPAVPATGTKRRFG